MCVNVLNVLKCGIDPRIIHGPIPSAKRKRGLHNHLPHLSFARGVAERRNQNYGTAANPGYHPSPLGRTSNRFSVKLELQSASSPFGAGHAVGWFWVIVVTPLGLGNSPILVMCAHRFFPRRPIVYVCIHSAVKVCGQKMQGDERASQTFRAELRADAAAVGPVSPPPA